MRTLYAIGLTLALAACQESGTGDTAHQRAIADGQALAVQHCSQCHAIGRGGASPNAKAPPFRILLSRYSETALEDDLREGIRIGHPDMPVIQLRPDGVDALIAYLHSVQEQP
jgi:mono/diheme cytochrome c family protein